MIYLLITLTLLQAADFYTTWYALKSGTGQEANPFVKKLMGTIGVIPTLVLLKMGLAALAWGMYVNGLLETRAAETAVAGLVVLYLVIVINNFKVIGK